MPKHSQQLFDLIDSANIVALEKFLEEQKEEIGLAALTALINQADDNGDTALHKAAKKNVPQILYALLFKDTDITIINKQGDTALHVTVDMGNKATLKYLLSRDKENKVINLPNHKGETPLQRALTARRLEVITYLLSFLPFLNVQKSTVELKQGIMNKLINEQDLPKIISACQAAWTQLKEVPYPDKEDKEHIKNLSRLIDDLKAKSKNTASTGFSFSKLFSKDIPKGTLPASAPAGMRPPGPIP